MKKKLLFGLFAVLATASTAFTADLTLEFKGISCPGGHPWHMGGSPISESYNPAVANFTVLQFVGGEFVQVTNGSLKTNWTSDRVLVNMTGLSGFNAFIFAHGPLWPDMCSLHTSSNWPAWESKAYGHYDDTTSFGFTNVFLTLTNYAGFTGVQESLYFDASCSTCTDYGATGNYLRGAYFNSEFYYLFSPPSLFNILGEPVYKLDADFNPVPQLRLAVPVYPTIRGIGRPETDLVFHFATNVAGPWNFMGTATANIYGYVEAEFTNTVSDSDNGFVRVGSEYP
ncbi:MAG: hypothetical protein KBC33_04080 [Candidatus Pacebacteria bacterium]|nr:hypothetical protein [Candidatus Paceibacterota bacterium]